MRTLRGLVAGVAVTAVVVLLVGGVALGALPDGRRWEMITPPQKNGGDVLLEQTETRTATSGDAVEFASLASFGDVVGNSTKTEYAAVRGSDGWVVHALTPPGQPLAFDEFTAGVLTAYKGDLSADLGDGVLLTKVPLTDAPNVAAMKNLYLRTNVLSPGAGAYQLITQASSPQAPWVVGQLLPALAGASADFSHVLFESPRNLTADAVAAGLDPTLVKVYEWVDGTVRLVGILPAGEGGGPAPSSQAGQGALFHRLTEGVITRDGSRVLFTNPDPTTPCDAHAAGSPACGALYMRNDQGTPATGDDVSVKVNASERTAGPDPAGSQPATYQAASSGVDAHGARVPWKVFFTTGEQLTDDDQNNAPDLYMWSEQPDSNGHHLTRLSVDHAPPDGDVQVKGVLGASTDGSYVYFIGESGQLDPTGPLANPNGNARIYVWHDGTVREVGGVYANEEENRLLAEGNYQYGQKRSEVTPDGHHLIFMTAGTNELTGYDHGSACANDNNYNLIHPLTACDEVYVYDATANSGNGRLSCASCNPSGQPATADAGFIVDGPLNFPPHTTHHPRAISDDGHYVFFMTAERLVPEDTNGQSDVYEYDTTTGHVHLISSGKSTSPSVFLDATPDGSNVFFATREQLVSADIDNSYDLYDARINGFTDTPPPPPVAPCASLETCRASGPTPFAPRMAGSQTFLGPNNLLQTIGSPPFFTTLPLSSAQKRALARGRRILLTVLTTQDGQLTATLQARINHHQHTLSHNTKTITNTTQTRLSLKLNPLARHTLTHHHRLRITITIDYSRTSTPQHISLTLHAP